MINDKKQETRIVVSQGDTTSEWHQPYNDASIHDIIKGFYSCLIGQTWYPEEIIAEMRRFVNENDVAPIYHDEDTETEKGNGASAGIDEVAKAKKFLGELFDEEEKYRR